MAEKNKKSWFSFKKKLSKTEKKQRSKAVRNTMIIFMIIAVGVGLTVGFIYLERFVKTNYHFGDEPLSLNMANIPFWVSPELEKKIVDTARKGGVRFVLNETVAQQVGENLRNLAWLYDVQVSVDSNAIVVNAGFRKPVAVVISPNGQFYLDSKAIILDYVPISKLTIVEIMGVAAHQISARLIGSKWQSDDVAAAIELIELLNKMDSQVQPQKPLLAEIQSIDVSNFNGRRSTSQPHIVFYAKDGTEIKWGARIGQWHKNLEARDEEKLAILYNTYKELGTIQIRSAQKGTFLDLTRQQNLSLPIDRY
ncbi:MAG: hypothetical protein A2Y10_02230 [Planctomycetes bacterium GWF2_41_51]|nr:MAG: hypothetical protein A2Y10_02230 [Planctomycetes bacterium GWF2_41_51]HBG25774.1 hypothetical protein [Phycisphaerales bacterium]